MNGTCNSHGPQRGLLTTPRFPHIVRSAESQGRGLLAVSSTQAPHPAPQRSEGMQSAGALEPYSTNEDRYLAKGR